MSDSINVETAFSCDFCGELFNSPQEAQKHNQKAHSESGQKNDSDRGLSTSSPAEDEEERRAS